MLEGRPSNFTEWEDIKAGIGDTGQKTTAGAAAEALKASKEKVPRSICLRPINYI